MWVLGDEKVPLWGNISYFHYMKVEESVSEKKLVCHRILLFCFSPENDVKNYKLHSRKISLKKNVLLSLWDINYLLLEL